MKSLTCLSLLLLHQVTQATLFKANNHFQQKAVSNTFIFDQDLWVANINDDGFDDLVITTNDNQGLMIYLGEREGKFKELFTTPVIGSVDISMVFDVDADGDSDIWLSLLNTDDERDVILINDGKGQFSKQNAISDETDTFNFSYDLLSGDLDNDGDLDVVKTFLGNEDPFNNTFVAEFFINDGAGNFLRHENQLSISRFSHLSDFNNDGYLDLITADYDLRVYYNDKSGFFQDTAHFHELNFPFGACENSSGENDSMLFEDIDNDGDIDIQLLSKALGLPRRINNGDGTFSDSGGQPCVPIEDPSNGAFRIDLRPIPTALFVDANQDGLKDLWVGYDDLSGPRVNFTDSNGFMTMDGIELEAEGVHYLAAGDFNQDNKADVVTLGSSGISSWIFESPVNYSKRDLQKINEQWGFVSSSAVEDFNGDGIVDLIFSKENGLYYRLGNGAGAFGESIKISSVGLYELQVLDFNSDGIKDAIGFDFNGEQPLLAIILRDHLDNHETKELPVPIDAFGLRQFEVSDIDGDGDKDLLLLLNVSIYVYQNQGEADFELIQRLDNNWYSAINFVDLNNQGRQAFIAYSVFDKLEPGIEEYHEWVWSGTLFELTRKARANRQESATVTMDFDGDGDLDILSTTRVDNEHHLLIVNETDVFTRSQYPYPGNAIEFAIDLNGDELV
ncbi:MAG: FG-GAP repeat domain-containing protein, partial [Marinicella sp.]